MKLLRQFLIILAISFVGEALKYLLPLPVPASIYGMVILFVGLLTGLIKLSWVKDAGKFLIAVMPVMFIPAGVGLMSSWGVLKPMIVEKHHKQVVQTEFRLVPASQYHVDAGMHAFQIGHHGAHHTAWQAALQQK